MPFTHINTYDEPRFKTRVTKTGIILQECTETNLCGLNLIRRNEASEETVISMSAKILGRAYPSLLSINTIGQALETVRHTGLLGDFAPDDIIQHATVLLCHVTQDLALLEAVEQYHMVLKKLHVNNKYRIVDYRNGNTLTFEKRNISQKAKEYAKLYGKARELEMADNKSYRESLSAADLAHVRKQFCGKTRFELELKNATKIKQYFKLPKGKGSPRVGLKTILTSDATPLRHLLEKLLQHVTCNPEKAEEKAFVASLSKAEKNLMGYCILYNHDLDAIQFALQQEYPKRPASARSEFIKAKELMSRWQAHGAGLAQRHFDLLAELKEQVGCALQ